VARLTAGAHPLTPAVSLLADETLKGPLREAVQARLENWLADHIAQTLEPLPALRYAADGRSGDVPDSLPGAARGIAFQLSEGLGKIARNQATLPGKLGVAIKALRPFGVRFGRRSIYIPRLLKPAPARLAALLW